MRGKGNPEDETGDIFFVFLAMIAAHDISIEKSFQHILNKLENIEQHPNILNKAIKHTGDLDENSS